MMPLQATSTTTRATLKKSSCARHRSSATQTKCQATLTQNDFCAVDWSQAAEQTKTTPRRHRSSHSKHHHRHRHHRRRDRHREPICRRKHREVQVAHVRKKIVLKIGFALPLLNLTLSSHLKREQKCRQFCDRQQQQSRHHRQHFENVFFAVLFLHRHHHCHFHHRHYYYYYHCSFASVSIVLVLALVLVHCDNIVDVLCRFPVQSNVAMTKPMEYSLACQTSAWHLAPLFHRRFSSLHSTMPTGQQNLFDLKCHRLHYSMATTVVNVLFFPLELVENKKPKPRANQKINFFFYISKSSATNGCNSNKSNGKESFECSVYIRCDS
jgi:hypothetical protein